NVYRLLFYILFHDPSYITFFFLSNPTSTTVIYTLSLHDALPICQWHHTCHTAVAGTADPAVFGIPLQRAAVLAGLLSYDAGSFRSEEHTSELQSRFDLVCRLLLEKKKKEQVNIIMNRLSGGDIVN